MKRLDRWLLAIACVAVVLHLVAIWMTMNEAGRGVVTELNPTVDYVLFGAPYLAPFLLLAYPLTIVLVKFARLGDTLSLIIGSAVLSLSAMDFANDILSSIWGATHMSYAQYLLSVLPVMTPTFVFTVILVGFACHEQPVQNAAEDR